MYHGLKNRAKLLVKIRQFFAERNILEVETPLLSHSSITDPNIQSFVTRYFDRNLYLQTSPEFAMKRLLAAGSGSIYQICKAFRNELAGRQHNPEFTILEWYRIGFNHHDLMAEMDEFLQFILETKPAKKIRYKKLFEKFLGFDPHNTSIEELRNIALKQGINDIPDLTYDDWLNILLTHLIEPHLGKECPMFIYDYPASQAALAKINNNLAERFEVYIDGIEIANGFHELGDSDEQRERFLKDLDKRRKLNLPEIPLDENFLQVLDNNFPDCAGVAVGIDRLLMLAAKTKSLKNVIIFPIDQA